MKLYMLVMQGQGDTHTKLVTQEIWDWIFSPQPAFKDYAADDPATPESVQLARQADGEDPLVGVTSGSCENDRALDARGAAVPFDEYGGSETVVEAVEWAKANGHEIVETWDGCIY